MNYEYLKWSFLVNHHKNFYNICDILYYFFCIICIFCSILSSSQNPTLKKDFFHLIVHTNKCKYKHICAYVVCVCCRYMRASVTCTGLDCYCNSILDCKRLLTLCWKLVLYFKYCSTLQLYIPFNSYKVLFVLTCSWLELAFAYFHFIIKQVDILFVQKK